MAAPVSLASHTQPLKPSLRDVAETRQIFTMILVGLTVQLYDHILTFKDEVNLIWRKRISVVSVVYLLNRYITRRCLEGLCPIWRSEVDWKAASHFWNSLLPVDYGCQHVGGDLTLEPHACGSFSVLESQRICFV